jgi:putative ABC transport system permease protein
MRTLFGLSYSWLLLGMLVLAVLVLLGLAWTALKNPLLPRLAWRNVPRRPGFAALITLGLTLGTVILSSAFTTGDTMSHSVRSVVAGVLGSADEVLFVPAPVQRSGWDLAQAVASGTLLTGLTTYFPESDVDRVREVLKDDPNVKAMVPIVLEQAAVSSDARGFSTQMNLLGVPPEAADLRAASNGRLVALADLGADEVVINTEAAALLGVMPGDHVHVFEPEATWRVREVTKLGDLGGGQATLFMPLHQLQAHIGKQGQLNQLLVINRGDPEQRLAASWPITVKLRSAFLDDQTASRIFRAMSQPAARELIARAIDARETAGRLSDKLRRLNVALDRGAPTPEFEALAQDPEVLNRLASRLRGTVVRGNTPFAAALAGASGFRVIDVQSVAQDQADRWGSAFTDLFVVLGAFSLFSGMLLIVLVFSLVALERRTELGISRALGARRSDVILLLALEGGLYSLIASLFGLGGGLALALAILGLAQGLVEQYGFQLEPVLEPTSLAASYGLGVVLTFVAVTVTAWRSSRFSIVTAIRDLPDPPPSPPGSVALLLTLALTLGGIGLVSVAISARLSLVYAAGVVVSIVGLALVARWLLLRLRLRGPERVVFTVAGFALVGWWLLPSLFPPVVEMSFLNGVGMLLGAVWVVAYNVGIVRRPRIRGVLWRLSAAYVASNRFRTGLTLAMFALVVLSLTLSAVMLTATRTAYADPEAVTGGWDIRVESSQPPRDLRAELATTGAVSPDAFAAIGSASSVRVEAIQGGVSGLARWQPANVLVVDGGFADAGAGWPRLADAGTAVVGAALLQPASNRLRVLEQDKAVLWLRDTRGTRPAVRVEVVGVADARGPFGNVILVGDQTLTAWPPPEQASYFLTVAPGGNARELAAGLSLSAPDLRAQTIGDELRLVQGVRGLLNMILQGFMGVGLLAGVAALGTLSTRAVVERRRQIGILRSLGFTARAVSLGLLLESALVALLGAAMGVGVGLFVAQNTIAFLSRQNPELRFTIPWDQLALVVAIAVGAALLMTILPARQAARLTPAEALREA